MLNLLLFFHLLLDYFFSAFLISLTNKITDTIIRYTITSIMAYFLLDRDILTAIIIFMFGVTIRILQYYIAI